MTDKKKHLLISLLISLLTVLVTFFVFNVGGGFFLETPLDLTNYLAMTVLGLLMGGIVFLFLFFKLYYAFGLFAAGLVVGSAFMLSTFSWGVAGWEDLGGLLSFFFLLAVGLGAGLLVQLVLYLVERFKN